MKITSPIKSYGSFYFKANINPRVPESGFSLCFGNTGSTGEFTTGVSFIGRSGLIFDHSGNFFGGYHSGRSLELEGHFFGDRLSYFYNGVLTNNNLPITSDFNTLEFDKHGNSDLSIDLYYVSGLRTEAGLQDSAGLFLISSDNFYILPS